MNPADTRKLHPVTAAEPAAHATAGTRARWPLFAAIAYTCFPIYGSLLPFRWQAVPLDDALAQFAALLQGPLQVAARTDFAANVLLALPLALLWLVALGPHPPASRPWLSVGASVVVWIACTALALTLEFAQIFFSGRQPALSDCIAQSIGALLGVAAWWLVPARVWTPARSAKGAMRRLLALYLTGVALYGLLPLDVTLSLSELAAKWRGGLVRLTPFAGWLDRPVEGLLDFVLDAGIWGLATVLAHRAYGPTTGSRALLLVAAAAALEVAQIFVLSRVVDTTDIVAAAAGVVAAVIVGERRASRGVDGGRPAAAAWTPGRAWAPVLGALAVLAIVVAPYPFSLSGATLTERLPALSQPPFTSYWSGTEYSLVTNLLRRIFLFGGFCLLVLWALHPTRMRIGMQMLITVVASASLAALVEAAQLFQPGGTVDSGDVLLAAAIGIIVTWVASALRSRPAPGRDRTTDVQPAVGRLAASATRVRWVAATLTAVTLLAALAFADSPSLPYNVRELLAPLGEHVSAAALVLGLVTFCGAAALLTHSVLPGRRGLPTLRPMLYLLGAPFALALLLTAGAPRESLDDIVGSPVLGSMPTLETLGRLTILVLGPFWGLALGAALQGSLMPRGSRGAAVAYLMVHGLWLAPVWHLVVVTWAGTDNLTELMADGGGVLATTSLLLYPVLLGAVGSQLLADAVVTRPMALVRTAAVLLLGGVAGYLVIDAGTEQTIMKYGGVFSALQFLLSVDRNAYATGSELVLRFVAAHSAACFCAAAGIAGAAAWIAAGRPARGQRERLRPPPKSRTTPSASRLGSARRGLTGE